MTLIPQRTLGPAGLRVSAVGLGCMGMSDLYGDASSRSEQTGIAVIHRALDAGISLLDTSDMYGPYTNEVLVGKALRDRRHQAVLATKFGIVRDLADATKRGVNGRPEYVRASCDASLKRLGTDYIDLFYQHRVDKSIPIEETIGAMAQLVTDGKVRYLGMSEAGAETLRRASAVHPISALQSEWSLWTREWEQDAFPMARSLGIGIVPYSPLGRGFLTGRFASPEELPVGDYRRTSPRFQAEHFDANRRLADGVVTMAREKGCTPAQVALAWVLSRGDDVVPIPGTTSIDRLLENIESVHVDLNAQDLARFEELVPRDSASGERFPGGMRQLVDK